jgi:hypothetical protein
MTERVSTRAFRISDMIVLIAATAIGLGLLRFMAANGCLFRTESIVPEYTYRAQCGYELLFPFLWAWTLAFLMLRLRRPRPRLQRLARQPGMAACSAAALALAVPMLAIVISEVMWSVRSRGLRATVYTISGIRLGQDPAPESSSLGSAYGPSTPINRGVAPATGSVGAVPALNPFPTIPGAAPRHSAPAPSVSIFGVSVSLPMLKSEITDVASPLWYIALDMHRRVLPRAYAASAVAGAWLVLVLAGWWRPERSWIDRFGRALGFGWLAISLVYHGAPLLFLFA